MPVSAETLRLLMEAGVHGDELLLIVESIDRTQPKERSNNAERQARFRAKKKAESVSNNVICNATESVTTVTPLAHVEDTLPTNKIINKEDNKKTTPRDELTAVLDAEHADAVLEHRIKLRKPLTAYAARQLAASFASCPDPAAAADLMIESGWLKIKPGWLESRSRQNGHGPPPGKRMNAVEAYLSLEAERENEQTSGTIDHGDDELLPPDQPGLPRPAGDLGQVVEWPVRQRDYQRG